ncbi:MAG: hypothetical protein HC838_00255 [Spirulinaceae cyanobacterium RM2_2_10]|nr:hypothetical protein [Spirulinaceae cyanobacterium SM2_1_0]NJO18799.1 hypothetical protein [Spirulinaceae cyanobacterium RM2_2_10]
MPATPSSHHSPSQTLTIPLGDRWRIRHRLNELAIPVACPSDGSLRVEIDCPLALILVRSTVQQFAASRGELVQWLERCWQVAAAEELGY